MGTSFLSKRYNISNTKNSVRSKGNYKIKAKNNVYNLYIKVTKDKDNGAQINCILENNDSVKYMGMMKCSIGKQFESLGKLLDKTVCKIKRGSIVNIYCNKKEWCNEEEFDTVLCEMFYSYLNNNISAELKRYFDYETYNKLLRSKE